MPFARRGLIPATVGEKRIEKSALEKEIRDRLNNKPESEKALFVKGGQDVAYGSVEDVAYAARAAGSKLIYLVTSGQTFLWKENSLSLTVPAGWKRDETSIQETVSWNGPEGMRLTFETMDVDELFSSPESAIQQEYEARSKLQKEGRYEEVRYLEVDGVKGLLTRSVDKGGDDRATWLRWVGYRRHEGKIQSVSLSLTSPLKSFSQRQYELYGILYSIKFAKN